MDARQMESESIEKLLGKMCLQATASLFIYNAYAFTDTWFVAKWAGPLASAGIGILAPVFFILSGISTTLGTGAASMLSRTLGAKEQRKSADVVVNAFFLFLCCSLIFTFIGELFLPQILDIIGAKEEIYDAALQYGRILIAGAITSTGFSGLMRAAGHLKYATIQWVIPILVNLCCDLVFVCKLGMGVKGAAWATICSQIVSAATCFYYFLFYSQKTYHIKRKNICLKKAIIKEIVAVGCPSLFQQIGNSIVTIIFQRMLISASSELVYAAYIIVDRIIQIFWTTHTGIAQGAQPLIGYYSGSGDFVKKKCVIHKAITISLLYGTGSLIICRCMFTDIFSLFLTESIILKYGIDIFSTLMWIFPIKGIGVIFLSYLQAEGETGKAWFLSLISIFMIQLPCLCIGKRLYGVRGLWTAMLISESIYAVCGAIVSRKETKNGKYYKK